MKTVLHTIDTTGPGGAETVFVNIASKVDQKRFRSVIALNGPGWVNDELNRRGFNAHLLNVRRNSSFDFGYLRQLHAIVARERVDLIQSHLFGSSVYSCLTGLYAGVPVISTFHGAVDIGGHNSLRPLKFAIVNAGSRRIVFVSEHLREEILGATSLSRTRATHIYNGIDLSMFSPGRDDSIRRELGFGADDIVVGTLGNVRPAKGYDILLSAAHIAIRSSPRLRFVICGHAQGSLYEGLLAQRAQLDLERHVFFLGFRPDVVRFLRNIDLFALSSRTEGLSIATIEAMACGVPIVATRSGGPQEILQDEASALLVEPSSPEQLATGILRLANDAELRSILSRNAVRASTRFSEAGMIAAYEEIYETISYRPRRAAVVGLLETTRRPPKA